MAIFDDLLRVKKIREQRAEKAMMAAKRAYEQAQDAHRAAIEALEKHRAFMRSEEIRLFDVLLKKKSVKVESIETVRQKIADMAIEENQKKEVIQQKQQQEEEALSVFTEKQTLRAEAQQARSKFEELTEQYWREEIARRQHAEEAELDELATLNYTPPEVI